MIARQITFLPIIKNSNDIKLSSGTHPTGDLWFKIIDDPRGAFFFDHAHAPGPSKGKPGFNGKTTKAVTLQTLLDALAPRDFIPFSVFRIKEYSLSSREVRIIQPGWVSHTDL